MTCRRVSTQTRGLANRFAIFTRPFYSRGYLPRELNILLSIAATRSKVQWNVIEQSSQNMLSPSREQVTVQGKSLEKLKRL